MKLREKVAMNQSKLAVWRSAIALSYIDHSLSNSEINLIREYLDNYDLSDSQLDIIDSDLTNGVSLDVVYPQIEDKRDRAHLINFARVLFHIDGEFSEVEQKILEKIHASHMGTIDLSEAMADARNALKDFEEKEKLETAIRRQNQNLLENAFDYLLEF